MGNQIVFKTSMFGGFERKSVLGYIDELNAGAAAAQRELEARLEEMSAQGRALGEQVAKFEGVMTALEEQLARERERTAQLTDAVEVLNTELANQRRTVREKEEIIAQKDAAHTELLQKVDTYAFKSRKYDETSMRVGAILIEARESAERIVERAQSEADGLRAQAQSSMQGAAEEVALLRAEAERLRGAVREMCDGLFARLDSIGGIADELEERLGAFSPQSEAGRMLEEMLEQLEEPAEAATPPRRPAQGSFFRPAAK